MFSIVIPAYNEAAVVGRTCRAIVAAFAAERITDYEILVINDASTDDTAALARAVPGVRVIEEPRKGLVMARETGRLAAAGDLLAFVDAAENISRGNRDQDKEGDKSHERQMSSQD